MRFRALHTRRAATRSSSVGSAAVPTSPRPLQARVVRWRSLWGRVYTRWAAVPATTTPVVRPASPVADPVAVAPPSTREVPASIPPAGLRAYLQRKRGELWFLTKRRADGDLQSADDADEVEVPPPPPARTTSRSLRSLLSRGRRHSSTSSELAIDMSSYSASSSGLEDVDDDALDVMASDCESHDEDDDAHQRDSYDRDPFLQRYSSWCSIDDEQARASECEGRSPALEELYEVRYVDVGGTPTPIAGIWI